MSSPLAKKIESTVAAVAELEQQVRDELWLDLALESAEFGAWYWDIMKGGDAVIRNDQYDRLFGIDAKTTWTVERLLSVIHPADHDRIREEISAVVSGRKNRYDVQYRIFRSDGIVRWIHSKGRNLRNPVGKVIKVSGVVRDISQQIRLQNERAQFVATLSHDLRNPLAAAKASAELIRRYPEQNDNRDKLLVKILNNVDRADGMIQDLLDMSRLQAGEKLDILLEEGDLDDCLQSCVADLRLRFGDRFRAETSGTGAGNWPLRALRRVIDNLSTNAVKYGNEETPILIQLQRNSGGIVLSVHNEGTSISADDQSKIFEPFFRGVGAKTSSSPGWGLGLLLVRGIANSLGGRITVQSSKESGTTFVMTFPISDGGLAA